MAEAMSFEMHIDDLAVDSGAVPVRWCLSRELAALVSAGEASVLVVVQALDVSESVRVRAESRQVLAVDDLMAFVSFTHPGRNRITAFLVARSVRQTKKLYLLRENGRREKAFDMDVFNRHASPDDFDYAIVRPGSYHVEAMTSRDVDVPREVFAPEPPEWEKRWVNLWHRFDPVDQCAFRRRRMLAYTLKPLAFIVAFAAVYLWQLCRVLLLVLLAARGDYWKVLRYPSTSVRHYHVGRPGSFYRFAKEHPYEDSDTPMAYARMGFSPLVILISALLAMSATSGMWSLLGALALPCLGLAASLLMLGFIKVLDRRELVRDRRKPARPPSRRPSRLTKEDLSYLTCDIAPGKASLATLPRRRRTIRLHLQELKRKVCRPFAG